MYVRRNNRPFNFDQLLRFRRSAEVPPLLQGRYSKAISFSGNMGAPSSEWRVVVVLELWTTRHRVAAPATWLEALAPDEEARVAFATRRPLKGTPFSAKANIVGRHMKMLYHLLYDEPLDFRNDNNGKLQALLRANQDSLLTLPEVSGKTKDFLIAGQIRRAWTDLAMAMSAVGAVEERELRE